MNLLPKNRQFFDYLDEISDNALDSSNAMSAIATDFPNRSYHVDRLRECEEKGDELTLKMLTLIREQFVTPLDSDDLFRLTKTLDDIPDCLYAAGKLFEVYNITVQPEGLEKQASLLINITQKVQEAVSLLRHTKKNRSKLSPILIEIHRLENVGDHNYHESQVELSHQVGEGEDPAMVLRWMKWNKFYDRLEQTIDAAESVANIIEGLLIK